MTTPNIPSEEERDSAEEAVIAADETTTQAEPEFYDKETVDTMVRSITRDPSAMQAFTYGLFKNAEFKKLLAMSFAAIYDSYTKMTNNALNDFEKVLDVEILDAPTGNALEFSIIWNDNDSLEFFIIDETGERRTYHEQHPGVKAAARAALIAKGIQPDSTVNYTALIVPRAATEVTIAGVTGIIAGGTNTEPTTH